MADDLHAVLALLYGSDTLWTTVRAEGEEWVDEEGSKEAFLRSVPPGAVVSSRGIPGPADRDPRWSVWVRQPGQSRADFGGAHQRRFLVIVDGDRVCASHPMGGGYRISEHHRGQTAGLGPAGDLLRPRHLLAALDLEVTGRSRLLGRAVIIVRGRPRPSTDRRGPGPLMGADEVELAVDEERGVLLRLEARFDGAPYRRIVVTTVAFDEDLDGALFAFPAGAGVGADTPPPVPPRPRRPAAAYPQYGPPDVVLGESVGRRTVLARTDSLVVAVDRIVAYPSGFELAVTVRTRDTAVFGSFDGSRRRAWSGTAAFPGESLRVTVVFADGRQGFVGNFGPGPSAAGGVTLVPVSGSGTQTRFDQRFWVEPLPPPGSLGLVVEWPSRGLGETRVDFDAGALLEAAGRAETLWPGAAE